MAAHKVTFGTLYPDGKLKNARLIKQSDIMKCPFSILVPDHYREDGSCKCNDAAYRRKMTQKWGYAEEDFKNIPILEGEKE